MPEEEEIGSVEKILFSMLATAHLKSGGAIGFRGNQWYAKNASTYIGLDEKGDIKGTWAETINVVQSLILDIKRERKNYDSVYFFFPDGSNDGITWRMLKIDMSFLRIVLEHDDLTMREIIRRFVRISEETQNGPAEPFKNLN